MALPYSLITFANKSGNIALANLDANFSNVVTYVEEAGFAAYVSEPLQGNITSVGTLLALSVSGITRLSGQLLVNVAPSGSNAIITNGNLIQTSGNFNTSGSINANGNIVAPVIGNSSSKLYGEGGNLTGLYGNANVSNYLASGTNSNNIITTGALQGVSVTATFATINTSLSTGTLGATSITASGTISANGNINGANVTSSANVNATNVNTTNLIATNITGNVISNRANIVVANVSSQLTAPTQPSTTDNSSNVATTAWVQGLLISGNSYGNSNVAAFLASGNLATSITTSANISGQVLSGFDVNATNAVISTNIVVVGNVSGGNILSNIATASGFANLSNNVTTTANIQGSYVLGNGSQLTGMYGDTNVQAYLPTYTGSLPNLGGNVTTTASVNATNVVATTVVTTPVVYASLPTAPTAGAGARAFITNANTTTFNSNVIGGGTNSIPVFSDGTSWRVG